MKALFIKSMLEIQKIYNNTMSQKNPVVYNLFLYIYLLNR